MVRLDRRVCCVFAACSVARRLPMPEMPRESCLRHGPRSVEVSEVPPTDVANRGNHLPGYPKATAYVVPSNVICHESEVWRECIGLAAGLGLGQLPNSLAWLHKLRRAMVRPGRDRLEGSVEVDETYLGGAEEGVHGRETVNKAIVAVAAEENGRGIGRIRLRRIADVSADSLHPFVEQSVTPGAIVHTDGWPSYNGIDAKGYTHEVTVLSQHDEPAHQLMPRVHRVASLLKRWLLGTHQGAVREKHLDYYLDEYTFRFNRRRSRARGLLFYRLLQNAVAVDPVPYGQLVGGQSERDHKI